MSTVYRIAVLVGSLRKESFNRKVAHALIEMAPPSLALEFVEIGDLPLYNQDLDENPASEWVHFRERLRLFDGVIFATPEYNRSIPGVLKNAMDVGSRPYGKSVWEGKPAAVISASPGALGGFGANHHLRQCLVFLDMPAMPQPEAYLSHIDESLGKQGEIKSGRTRDLLEKFIAAYAQWVARYAIERQGEPAASGSLTTGTTTKSPAASARKRQA